MKLELASQAAAQTRADEIHAWLIANDAAYAKSVQLGQTVRWSFAKAALDDKGVATGKWDVTTKPRVRNALTTAEKLAEKP